MMLSLIVSFDSIVLKPSYEITSQILYLVASISEKSGAIRSRFLDRATPQLRKQNQIKTIHSSLSIEGNTLSLDQVTALLDNKRVAGPKKDIDEVLNAIKVYEDIERYNPFSQDDFLKAHGVLMEGLIKDAGQYRKRGAGIVKGDRLEHLAPPHHLVPHLMSDLFDYLKSDEEILLIRSCVFHYEMEFIHPFSDGNGRMGRLWQMIILAREYPVFEYQPFETLISKSQEEYYGALAKSDKAGNSTCFIEYMLSVLDRSLEDLSSSQIKIRSQKDRLEYFVSLEWESFVRKDYMAVFKDISTATASRDLKIGVDLGLFEKDGTKNKATYSRCQRK
jgi:Fic family protein